MLKDFRLWWHRPEMHDANLERKVSWLELFYDLVYVVAIAELSHSLALHPDAKGMLSFVFLFLPLWFAWTNGTYYHDLFETYDVSIRFFTLLQMLCVIGMAIFAHNALDKGSVGFALSYALHHLLMTYLWWRAGHHDERFPGHTASYTLPYIIPYSFSVLLFIISVFVPTPLRFYLWGLALTLDFIAPILASLLMGQSYSFSQVTSAKMLERFGLFTIIVLGESIVGVVRGIAAHHELSWFIFLAGILGVLISFSLWWIYFDTTANRQVKAGIWYHNLWLYLHMFMYMTMTASGAGILNVVEGAGHELSGNMRYLLGGAIGLSLISMGILQLSFKAFKGIELSEHRNDMLLKLSMGTLAIVLAYLLKAIGALGMLSLLWLLILVVVFYIFRVWLRIRREGLISARPEAAHHN
ncbi:MAG: low temperature requirement protein A [Deinococcales bacterium]